MKRSKYNNKKCTVDGVVFDSKGEANRYLQLKLLEQAGEISELKRQVEFEIIPPTVIEGKRQRPVKYVADFVYMKDGKQVVEDFKGFKTEIFKIKRKAMKAFLGIDVVLSK